MTQEDFRRIALGLPEATENEHMGHPDFRVHGRIFATLSWPDNNSGVVMFSPEEQAAFIRLAPAIFQPAKGAWGRSGSTQIRLESIDERTLRDAIVTAWTRLAAKPRKAKQKPPPQSL